MFDQLNLREKGDPNNQLILPETPSLIIPLISRGLILGFGEDNNLYNHTQQIYTNLETMDVREVKIIFTLLHIYKLSMSLSSPEVVKEKTTQTRVIKTMMQTHFRDLKLGNTTNPNQSESQLLFNLDEEVYDMFLELHKKTLGLILGREPLNLRFAAQLRNNSITRSLSKPLDVVQHSDLHYHHNMIFNVIKVLSQFTNNNLYVKDREEILGIFNNVDCIIQMAIQHYKTPTKLFLINQFSKLYPSLDPKIYTLLELIKRGLGVSTAVNLVNAGHKIQELGEKN